MDNKCILSIAHTSVILDQTEYRTNLKNLAKKVEDKRDV